MKSLSILQDIGLNIEASKASGSHHYFDPLTDRRIHIFELYCKVSLCNDKAKPLRSVINFDGTDVTTELKLLQYNASMQLDYHFSDWSEQIKTDRQGLKEILEDIIQEAYIMDFNKMLDFLDGKESELYIYFGKEGILVRNS